MRRSERNVTITPTILVKRSVAEAGEVTRL
jgi:hypothetical protein